MGIITKIAHLMRYTHIHYVIYLFMLKTFKNHSVLFKETVHYGYLGHKTVSVLEIGTHASLELKIFLPLLPSTRIIDTPKFSQLPY